MFKTTLSAALIFAVTFVEHAAHGAGVPESLAWPVDKYDVSWDSPSQDAKGSMPLGNGDIGMNVWVEPNGDLVLLVAKTDSYDEFNRLLKLGRIRIRTTPALVQPGQPFSQVLRLSDGLIEIKAGTADFRVWVDANHPVAEVNVTSEQPVSVKVTLEDWRKEKRKLNLSGDEPHSARGNWPDKLLVNPDTILPAKGDQLAWCHHNEESQWKRNLKLTGLGSEVPKEEDPVLDRTFGAVVRGSGCKTVSDTELQSEQPVKNCSIQIFPLTCKAASPDAWMTAALAGADKMKGLAETARLRGHEAWWHSFWNRSWIDITGGARIAGLTFQGPLQLGRDPNGGSRFAGSISGAFTANQALTDSEIARMASGAPGTAAESGSCADISLGGSFTAAAWIKPAPGEVGRIFDKGTPGQANGLLFDTYPGLSLRYSLGLNLISHQNVLKAGEWQHVAATFDADTGRQALYLKGKLIEERMLSGSLVVARTCALQRFISACSGRGGLPVRFNGSLFCVDGPDPDFRMWGSAYWFQNTRLNYWPMLDSGDYEMMLPFFAMYRNALPLREAATKAYYHHGGAFFPETMYFWGNFDDEDYGFAPRGGMPDGLTVNSYIRRYWQGGIELTAMMLDYYDDTQDAAFRDKTLLPIAGDIVTFFDQHWQRGADGKILFDPAQSLETWHTAKNPLPEIAGLRYIIPRLLELPVDTATKQQWRKTLADLPAAPTMDDKDGVRLLPAETYSDKRNGENPELYAVFPYRLYTSLASDEDQQIGLNTWRHRLQHENNGWQQNNIQAAMLGLAGEAQALAVSRASATAAGYRFPGFFGPNYDWTPDQDHANNVITGVQRMLMQYEGKRIVLLPAWPADWNASFKLHAPMNTIVEGRVENGKLKALQVTPESRRKDVEIRAPGKPE